MNLNPLFWVNELKEIGQRMKAAGPINSILWCITLPHHSSTPLLAFCLYPLCYSLIILSGVRVRVANCAEHLSLRMAKRFAQCWHSLWLCPATLNYANYYNSLIYFLFFYFFLIRSPPSVSCTTNQTNKSKYFLRTVMGTFHLALAAAETLLPDRPTCTWLRPRPAHDNQLHATCVDCNSIYG